MLAVGIFKRTWTDDRGRAQTEKMKFAGRILYTGETAASDDDKWFEGVAFDMQDRAEGTFSMTRKEFLKQVESWHEAL